MNPPRQPPANKTLRSLHRWAGLLAALVLLVAAISGSLLAFKKPLIHSLVCPDASLPAGYSSEHIARELHRISQHPAYLPTSLIKAPNDKEPYWSLLDNGNTVLLEIGTLAPFNRNLWVIDSMAFLHTLHVTLLAGTTGETIMLIAGLLGLGLTATGLVIWWPGRRGFRWRWVFPKTIRAPLLLQYHRHSGAASALLSLVLLLTGSLMMWQIVVSPLLPKQAPTRLPGEAAGLDQGDTQALFSRALARVPDGWPTYIRLGSRERPDFSLRVRLPGEWHPNGRTSVVIERPSGDVLVSARSDQVGPARWLVNQLYPLHAGYGMGTLYSIAVLVGGLFMAWLSVSGTVAYFRRRRLQR